MKIRNNERIKKSLKNDFDRLKMGFKAIPIEKKTNVDVELLTSNEFTSEKYQRKLSQRDRLRNRERKRIM